LGCYGEKVVRTPHLDAFAREGLRLTSCYAAAPNCSPARTGLMTGRTPSRVGVYNWIPMHCPMHVRRREITIATLLRNAGYQTAHMGKWHLNGDFNLASQPQPWDHGFSHWFSTQNNALPNHHNPVNFVKNGQPVGKIEGYAADIVAAEAVRWLKEDRDPQRPFFMYVCFHEPHEPIATAPEYARLYPSEDPSYSAHHGNITQMDAACGRILAAVDRLKLRDSTFVLFTSDNGPAITSIHPHGSAGPLREKKGYLYEGGIRVPGIIRWPGRAKPGATSDTPVCGVDLLPTLCELAGIATPAGRVLDGCSFAPLLAGKPLNRQRPLYWQFHRARGAPKVAMRDGDWKLLAAFDSPALKPSGGIEAGEIAAIRTAELTAFELYHLTSDTGERKNLAATQPQRVAAMKQQMQATFKQVNAEGPLWPAWEFERYEGQRIVWPPYRKRGKPRTKPK